ncbi:MAG: hypothetical protein BHW10_04405 [Clostridium sp. CAG:307_30_263]|nr:MAG: hypothetical protein BHW10_04405 [Clostridium sp. CAG:307_30_263]
MQGIILSAGYGVRLDKYKPKPLVEILGKPLIDYAYDKLKALKINEITIIKSPALKLEHNCRQLIQALPLGTGDALKLIKEKGTFLVLPVDTPLVSKETLSNLIKYHFKHKNDITILASKVENPYGYGRIFNYPLRIKEEKDLTNFQRKKKLVNAGIYILNDRVLKYLDKIEKNKITLEYYFTDIFKYLPSKIKKGIYQINKEEEILGINTPLDLIKVTNLLSSKINQDLRKNNVFVNKAQIGPDVKITPGVKISDNSIILGNTIIEGNTYIIDSLIEDSKIISSIIGPYAHLKHSIIEESTIGNFVEVKNSEIKKQVKAKHLSYIGNASIEDGVNIGAGVIFSNFDGKIKSRSKVGSYSFIGSNSTIIAPITIGSNCYIGAGSEVTSSLNDNTFYLRRGNEKRALNKKLIEKKE